MVHLLLTEANRGDGDLAVERLRAAGVRVTTCHVRSGFCRALAPGRNGCPLDDRTDPVAGVVDARGPDSALTPRELGVVCGIRAQLPVFVVETAPGRTVGAPTEVAGRVVVTTADELCEALRQGERCRDSSAARGQP